MRISFKILFILTLCAFTTNSQTDSVLVKIGNNTITAREFKERFELTPQIYKKGVGGLEKLKSDLLYSMIAEKLWALETENLKLDSNQIMNTTFKALEKMFIRDALYRFEVKNKVTVNHDEILEEANKYITGLILDPLFAEDSTNIFKLYNNLLEGTSFDSIKGLTGSDLPNVEVESGDLEESFEEAVFKLKLNEFTPPLKSNSGWFIFRLSGTFPSQRSGEQFSSLLKEAEKNLNEKKADQLSRELYKQLISGKRIETDGNLFWNISDKISAILTEKKIKDSIADDSPVILEGADIIRIESEFGSDTLNMPFIHFDEQPLSTKEFLRYFIFEGFYSAQVEPDIIAAKLNSRVKRTIELELFAREGYKRGLQNLPDVKHSLDMWKNNYLASIFRANILSPIEVEENELYDFYTELTEQKNYSATEVNILEILTDSLEVVESILNKLNQGSDFRELARQHTKRVWTRENGGEFGFFPVTIYGEIGRAAANMEIGEIYGPIKLPEGYSIFKLIDKRTNEHYFDQPFEESKEKLARQLKVKKLNDFLTEYTIKLANEHGVTINENLFNKLEVQKLDMYVIRYLGFGGRVTAVPLTYSFSEWFELWRQQEKDIP
jgi:parvulin-like peptidyl-prolyl isomerase